MGAVEVVDLGFEFFNKEAGVAAGFASAKFEVTGGGVFGHAAEAGIGDAEEDDWFNLTGFGEAVGGGMGTPGVAGDIGGEVVEEVLTVVKIEDRKTAVGI